MNTNNSLRLCLFISIFIFCQCDYEFYMQGKRIYESNCQNCHMDDGEGLRKLIPDISNSKFILSDTQGLVCLIRNGPEHQRNDGLQMPAYPQFNSVEMCNLVNYLNHRWGQDFEEINILQMDSLDANCSRNPNDK